MPYSLFVNLYAVCFQWNQLKQYTVRWVCYTAYSNISLTKYLYNFNNKFVSKFLMLFGINAHILL